ncbi:bacteriohopanetetrol glucosamine biosynthesis glycosyltransferase HpnI [Massilia agilis]|uniref:Bacteriohopanetetrol glucosamine biosynthesis glycosyltransferase HpnI n=1 Tax=Massilia agilis TaxID=1811226 RepID=A0ABT2DBK5_9BURK|nr:bacteriohopanetetrol glucosamine biosynthesis glycosyltransferase HpnI [Massilia agilis]MCS0808708.1 bacteriohopanetetrol glucosamine biosynthesis glycosyltransferase HpnI [Massilia agilis]
MATLGSILILVATLYALTALLCRPRTWRGTPAQPRPVTVLKPLCGAEPRLEANLALLCEQDWPEYQIVFGVRDPNDPAIDVVRRLARRYPACDIALVVDARTYGTNFKVSNLINMARRARHPWLVIADSDIAVPTDYLAQVTAPLADAHTGIVTCLYRGRAFGGFWSRMGALFIDTWFAPSVRVASAFGSTAFGFGATIALRADTLRAIGGFEALRDRLADDYWLGAFTRELGLATVLSPLCVATDVVEHSFAQLWTRERRWMQTIRSINPAGYAFSFITFTFPMIALGLWLSPGSWPVALLAGVARCALHLRRPAPRLVLYAPLRDCLLLATWCAGFAGATTRWRRQAVPIDAAPRPHLTRGPIR